MKRILIVGVVAMSLSGCNAIGTAITAIPAVDNDLARLARGSIPAACGIIAVAEGYFANVKGSVSPKNRLLEAKAAAGVKVICDNPPTNVVAAFTSLMGAWSAIQAATTI